MFPKYTRLEQLGTDKQTFLITIAILEGRHYAWPNMDSVVIVQAFGKKETTVVVHNSDCPYYNEYFTFEKKATPEKILNSEITFIVVQPRTIFRGRKVLGTFKVDVATVWDEPDHQFYNKWAVLNAPTKKYTPGARGYLKVNITLITKNISPSIPPTPKDVEIEGNLLLPHSLATERSKANFEFDIYKGEHFYANGKAPTSCIEISFSGNKGRTTLQKNTSFPVFNQRIVLRDMFPPLSQRIYVKIFFGKTLHAFNLLNFKDLISEVEEGVVPCFGPSFLHFYENENMEEYKGSLLLGIKTKLAFEVTDRKKQTNIVSIAPCSRDLFPLVEIRLFCVIFECSALDKRFDGNVIFRATIGNEIISRDMKVKNLSDKIRVRKINRNSRFLIIKNKKPFLSLPLNAIDCRKKLYNFNMMDKILNTMEQKLESIGILFNQEDISIDKEIEDSLTEALEYLHSSSKKYIDIVSNYNLAGLTPLDKMKIENNLKTMESISNKAKELFDPLALRRTFLKTRKLCDELISLSQCINDTWPDLFISTWKDNKKLAYVRIPCKELLHSRIEEEMGMCCGNMTTLYLQAEKKKKPSAENVTTMVGKMEVLLWIGAEKYTKEFLKNLPLGFEENSEKSTYRYLATNDVHIFHCKCHLFQGRVNPGLDSSALSDTMVRVHIGHDCQETTIEQQTLNPVWNQTLIFKRITLYGDISFIKSSPPSIIVELLDRDNLFSWELIGKTSVKPVVKAKDEPYGPPNFPPTLKWFNVFNTDGVGADILAAFEMLETTGSAAGKPGQPEKDIIRIPTDIKPNLVDFRIEVLFWGVRDLKKIQMRAVNRPRVTIECAKTIFHSEILQDARKNLNFKENIKTVELKLPSNFEFASPLIIRMMDKRAIASYVLVGTSVSHLKSFGWQRITEVQRQDLLMGNTKYQFKSETQEDANVGVSDVKRPKSERRVNFIPQHCFCRTSQAQKLVKNISKIRCICTKTRWQKFRQKFNKKKIFCPCLEEYQEELTKVEKEHKRTCPCCRNLLKKLHSAVSDKENQLGYLRILRGSCYGNKCGCCSIVTEKIKKICTETEGRCKFCRKISGKFFKDKKTVDIKEEVFDDQYDDADNDWWTKYYASLEPEPQPNERIPIRMKYRLKIYSRELETLPDFHHFKDMLMSFPMFKGKRTGDEIIDKEMVTGIFKGAIKIYRWTSTSGKHYVTRTGRPLSEGYFSHYPSNEPLHFTLRVYCVKAIHLPPKDLSGKCDPYLLIRLQDKEVIERDDYKMNELNPIFGKMYKFNGWFPKDNTLLVQVWDRDVASRDDLIGETKIDIENRYYTEHRANCAIPEFYEETGYCAWRDQIKPSKILSQLCLRWNLPKPEYATTSVKICSKIFESPAFVSTGDDKIDQEIKALYALRNWHEVPYVGCRLVPEHVETRSLFHPKKALIEQGKIQLWIDIFSVGDFPPPPPVDITVKPPVPFELRVIIWNTADVVLQEDDFFTNQKKSDIFVKGMLLGYENVQSTDVHYRSLTGEGNFNWRFIFPMEYLPNEDKTVTYPDGGKTTPQQNGMKFPCRLTIQVWENDTLSKDDFLGTLTLDLAHMPRGAKSPEQCTLAIIDPYVPHINIFKVRRTKGWWPFKGYDLDGNFTLVGKVEMEFEMLPSEEAQKTPAGLGRTAPQPLPEPKDVREILKSIAYLIGIQGSCFVLQGTLSCAMAIQMQSFESPKSSNDSKRPDTSFSWLLNPLKALKHVVCKLHRWKCICCCCWLLLFIFVGLAIYAFPGYFVKKILHV